MIQLSLIINLMYGITISITVISSILSYANKQHYVPTMPFQRLIVNAYWNLSQSSNILMINEMISNGRKRHLPT
ncbi:CLUMA_CG009842, isoform A [Clunio marinus]|uniref:CLUMA_CG009842, isoform A n=1 Tax=Clunio marinus TaxID=568069 RepID=A0A1J1I9L2_9DIPT|nr:CLUMA_CG009842, isoform A [Clunio marinus]